MAQRRRKKVTATFVCPNCGEDVRVGALACPECGSDAETGWSDETLYDGIDLPWDGQELERSLKPGVGLGAKIIGIVLLILFVLAML